jgi:hypothetical protein
MSELIAKPVVKNKFWVVEQSGQKVATIQAVEDGSIVYVHNDYREKYPSIKILSKQHNIKFTTATTKAVKEKTNQVYGYPVSGKFYNVVYDVKKRLPIYTKTEKSKSQYCAGYYLLLLNNVWTKAFCPKSISVNRYQYLGPFRSEAEMSNKLKEVSHAET